MRPPRDWPWRGIGIGLFAGVVLWAVSGGRLIFFLLPLGLGMSGWLGGASPRGR